MSCRIIVSSQNLCFSNDFLRSFRLRPICPRIIASQGHPGSSSAAHALHSHDIIDSSSGSSSSKWWWWWRRRLFHVLGRIGRILLRCPCSLPDSLSDSSFVQRSTNAQRFEHLLLLGIVVVVDDVLAAQAAAATPPTGAGAARGAGATAAARPTARGE